MPFPPAYTPRDVEEAIEKRWEASGFFNPDTVRKLKKRLGKPFSIVMPPPNATGILHIGHATMLAIEDIMVRYHRMKGDDTLWIPGTDHAAIATQNVVEKELWKHEHKTRQDLGREQFLKRVEEFVEKSKTTIRKQIRTMGSSCDWSREAYTMDATRSAAVNTMFKMMYDDGLVYRGKRIVNWCPRCKSTLADDEVEYKEEKTPFYYFKYGPVVIGTVRPETKFLDKTVVVHPRDTRYKKLVGTEFDVEWVDGKVRANVIADPVADMDFGSGAMTITPAHSFEDFDLAQRHQLPITEIIDENGDFTHATGSFAGKNARASRQAIVDILKAKGLVDHVDERYTHNLSVCYRCDTPIEPLPKRQWFVGVSKPFRNGKSLKDLALAAVRNKEITIVPERFTKEYFHWMENLRDWCISRQIWFGHRIPVWYCIPCHDDPKKFDAGEYWTIGEKPDRCPRCGSTEMHQDQDTFDTWFSSGLWTFSTLGWPAAAAEKRKNERTKEQNDLARFHPTSVLETGYDILFFWIARMVLMTEYALKDVPFKTVYLHGLVRDAQGRKMSKSIGNTIDPLVVAEKFGTDAVRLSLVVGTTPGNDLKLSEQKIEGYRNFVNKLWNIARYVASQESQRNKELGMKNYKTLTLADQWILSRLERVTKDVTEHIEGYRFSQAAEALRHFTWDELADWFIEISKFQISNLKSHDATIAVLEHVLATLLKLWHPFTPFVTEAIWQELGHGKLSKASKSSSNAANLLIIAEWPKIEKKFIDATAEKTFAAVQSIVREIRSARADFSIPPSVTMTASWKAPKTLANEAPLIAHLTKTNVEELGIKNKELGNERGMLRLHPDVSGVELILDLREYINVEKETARLKKSITETETYIAKLQSQLKDKAFLKNAPRDIVSTKKAELNDQTERLKKLQEQLKSIA